MPCNRFFFYYYWLTVAYTCSIYSLNLKLLFEEQLVAGNDALWEPSNENTIADKWTNILFGGLFPTDSDCQSESCPSWLPFDCEKEDKCCVHPMHSAAEFFQVDCALLAFFWSGIVVLDRRRHTSFAFIHFISRFIANSPVQPFIF